MIFVFTLFNYNTNCVVKNSTFTNLVQSEGVECKTLKICLLALLHRFFAPIQDAICKGTLLLYFWPNVKLNIVILFFYL